MKPRICSFLLGVTALSFLGCGGGGSDSGTNPTPVPAQDPAGIWIGTNTYTGGSTASIISACDEQGNFRYFASDDSVGVGKLTVSGASFTGTGTVFTSSMAILPLSFSGGALTSAASITSHWSAGSYSGDLTVAFNALYNRPASLATVAGAYAGTSTSGSSPELTILADGSFTGTSTGGAFSGTISTINPAKNLFQVAMTQEGETYTGLAFWADSTATAPLVANTFYVHVSNSTYGMAAILTKQ